MAKNISKNASPLWNRAHELRTALARKIASFMGSEENRATHIPGVTMSLRLAMAAIRELLSREEIQVAEAPSGSPAMATGEVTAEFLGACCRLMELLDTPPDIPFLSGLIQREIIYRILFHESPSVSETNQAAGSAGAHAR